MNIRPYLTFNGNCLEAIRHYEKAFNLTATVSLFKDMPKNPQFQIPDEFMERVLQATINFGDNFIRMSDCGPMNNLNDANTEKLSIAVEAEVDVIKKAFEVLCEGGQVGMPLAETFFSPCHGVVYDKFGIMWNLIGVK